MNGNDRLPLVSIITPAYNRQSLIEETILSVIGQDYPNIEYLVLDDGSSDDTLSVIKKYAKHLRYEAHPNMGETRTVNKGLGMVRGEIIAVVNSDDPLLPGVVRAAVELMVQRPEILVAYPDWYIIDENGFKLGLRVTPEYDYLRMLKRHDCIPGPGAFFRKSVAERLGGRDGQFRYVADFDFWLRAGLLGPFARIPKALATFRWHEGGASSREQGTSMAQEHIRLVEKIYSLPSLPGPVLRVKKEAFSNAYYEAAVSLGTQALDVKKDYFRRAVALYPWKYLFHEKLSLAESLILMLLGGRVYLAARKMRSDLVAAYGRKRRDAVLPHWGQDSIPRT
jgi:glycosyltransferase involved in cell wall biosynthesis